MLGVVLGEAGKAALLHELLLTGEVHAGKFDQSIEQRVHRFLAASVDHGLAELVHGVHEDAALVVKGADADGAGVVPGEKSHVRLHWLLVDASAGRVSSLKVTILGE